MKTDVELEEGLDLIKRGIRKLAPELSESDVEAGVFRLLLYASRSRQDEETMESLRKDTMPFSDDA